MSMSPEPPAAGAAGDPSLSLIQRAIAVFARPAQAWGGLETRPQWWFPLLIILVVAGGMAAVLHDRALLPMIEDQWDQRVADGQMTAQQVQGATDFMSGPIGRAITIVQQSVVITIATLLWALLLSIGAGFMLGGKLRFRLALEVAAWTGLVGLPGQILAAGLAWTRETFKGVHVGFGAFLPENDPPTKLMTGLGVFLDALGPFSIWTLVVSILGAAALSKLPPRKVAWTISILYLVLWGIFACLAAAFTPGS